VRGAASAILGVARSRCHPAPQPAIAQRQSVAGYTPPSATAPSHNFNRNCCETGTPGAVPSVVTPYGLERKTAEEPQEYDAVAADYTKPIQIQRGTASGEVNLPRSNNMESMSTGVASKTSQNAPGVVFSASCQNPGCGNEFDLRLTPANAECLSRFIACPYCRRNGGLLKPQGRIGNRRFAAKLYFQPTGVASGAIDAEYDDV
jgi:hypothetical protein